MVDPTRDEIAAIAKASGWTRLAADYVPLDAKDCEPGWRIHDFPEDSPFATWICDGLEVEAEAKLIVEAVNYFIALKAHLEAQGG